MTVTQHCLRVFFLLTHSLSCLLTDLLLAFLLSCFSLCKNPPCWSSTMSGLSQSHHGAFEVLYNTHQDESEPELRSLRALISAASLPAQPPQHSLHCTFFTVILTSCTSLSLSLCLSSLSPDQGCVEAVWRRVRAAVRGGPLQQRPLRDRRRRTAAVAAASQKGQYCCCHVCIYCMCVQKIINSIDSNEITCN